MRELLEFSVENAGIIAAIPLWAFLIIVFGRNFGVYENKKITSWLTCAGTFVGLALSLVIFIWTLTTDEPFSKNINWIEAGRLKLSFGWLIDNLCAMMLLVVTSVSLLIQIYSHGYMEKDEGYHRFFAYLNLFNFSMLGLVLSSNLFQTYIFWELVGLSSYLLIGFWFKRPSAAHAATKAFLINRIGDFGLLVGTIAFLYFSLSYWESSKDVFLGFTALEGAAKHVFISVGSIIYYFIALGIFFGSIAKSAQFPLHTWLPDAMEGPTPISALIHAATMVAAGVFLIARVYPIFYPSSCIMTTIAWVGGITAFITAVIALTQYDIKKVLAYSTCSQLGYMVMAMGAGVYSAGLFHLMTHAYFKAMLFLCSGSVIHGLSDQQDMRYMGGLKKYMPIVANTYLVGCIAISGILFSGFWSKEEIFSGLLEQNQIVLLIFGLIISGMTSFYMFRTYFLTFEGEYRGHGHPHNLPGVMTIPLIILAVPSAFIGFLLSGNFGLPSFNVYIQEAYQLKEDAETTLIPLISLVIALAGLGFASFLYLDGFKELRKKTKINPDKLIQTFKPVYSISQNLWYIDKAYYCFINKVFLPVTDFMAGFDKFVIDGLVNCVALMTKFKFWILRYFQNGQIQTYISVMFTLLMGITLLFLIVQYIIH
jgi:NAD(P)H-quinone oxidoreductase subunit 5